MSDQEGLRRWVANRAGRAHWAVAAVLAIGTLYLVALALVPSRFMTTDAANYVSIGRNVLSGAGPVNAFGIFFPFHSPAWPIVVMSPEVVAGVSWTAWSRVLNIGGAVAVLAMTGLIAARWSRVAAVLAVATFAAYGYGFELARTLGLDEATAVTSLVFVLVALRSGPRRPTTWGIVLGITFGIAFLIKESVLPLAPLPVLVVLSSAGWRPALRLLGVFAAVAFAISSWWFLVYASYLGTVYRVGTPAWTLGVIAAEIVALLVVGFLVGRDRPEPQRDPALVRRERVLAWGAAFAWAVLLTAFFQFGLRATASSMLRPGQYAFYVRDWFPSVVPISLVAGTGSLVVVAQRLRGRVQADAARYLDALVQALVLSIPLVLVVIAVGDPPRHYIAQLAIFVALGAIGWECILTACAARLRSVDRTRTAGALLLPIVLVLTIAASGLLVVRAARHDLRPSTNRSDRALAAAIADVGDWLGANLRPGDKVVVGSILNYEIATRLGRGTPIRIVRQDQNVQPRHDGPLGLTHGNDPPTDDWVALKMDPHHPNSFYGYRRAIIEERLAEVDGDVWIEGGIVPRGTTPPIIAALSSAAGLERVGEWTIPFDGRRDLRLAAFRRGDGPLAWTTDELYLSGATLERLVRSLEAHRGDSAAAARALADRAVVVDGARPDLIARLVALGGG